MAYASWSVVFGEQPSAAKWNILGTNDSTFNDKFNELESYAFRAYLGTQQDNVSNGDTIQIDTENYDYNSNFNTGTYTYTAPRAGVYHFNGGLTTEADDARLKVIITVNAATAATGGESTKRGSVVAADLLLAASDTVVLTVGTAVSTSDISDGTGLTWFAGRMVIPK